MSESGQVEFCSINFGAAVAGKSAKEPVIVTASFSTFPEFVALKVTASEGEKKKSVKNAVFFGPKENSSNYFKDVGFADNGGFLAGGEIGGKASELMLDALTSKDWLLHVSIEGEDDISLRAEGAMVSHRKQIRNFVKCSKGMINQ